jgi:transcriptional regulator with PAS, ATPase and Fis domain
MAETSTERQPFFFTDDRSGALRARRFRLRVLSGPAAGTEVDLAPGTFLIGAHEKNHLRIVDRGISRYHLELQFGPEGLRVNDLESSFGTFQGTDRIQSIVVTSPVRLRLGEETELTIEPEEVELEPASYASDHFGEALGGSTPMRELFGLLQRVAAADASVLLEGETGTGKELLAHAIHAHSPRQRGPFVVIDCSAMAKDLVGAELFGYVRGAFTGAATSKQGLLESAAGGTVFLDEIGELPVELQPLLLRALEKREVRPIGDVKARKIDVRIVAATHRNLTAMMRDGSFRPDLYYRLAVVRARVPALRQRLEDIPLLVRNFARSLGHERFELSPSLLSRLMAYEWPGNVRELRNVLERGFALDDALLPEGEADDSDLTAQGARRSPLTHDALLAQPFKEAKTALLDAFTREYLEHLLERHAGNMTRVAADAGIDRNQVYRLVKRYRISVD